MGKISDVLRTEAEAAEAAELSGDQATPLSAGSTVTRGNPRARNLQVRFREEEFDELSAYADVRELPVSTVVRMLVLQAIAPVDDLRSALDQLESDLVARAPQGAQRQILKQDPAAVAFMQDGQLNERLEGATGMSLVMVDD